MGGGPSGPFVMRTSRVGVGIAKADFGMSTCPSSGGVAAALSRKGVVVKRCNSGSPLCRVHPKRATICRGNDSLYGVQAGRFCGSTSK